MIIVLTSWLFLIIKTMLLSTVKIGNNINLNKNSLLKTILNNELCLFRIFKTVKTTECLYFLFNKRVLNLSLSRWNFNYSCSIEFIFNSKIERIPN